MGDDDALEYTLLTKNDVLVYQIPPASSSQGHKADDWKKCIWRGRCRVAGKGSDLCIKMLDMSTGALFAQCTIPGGEHDKYVERVIDSSRYFVLKISNGARHAFIGLGFEDRNDAFDFNCTLCDFKTTWVDGAMQDHEESATPIDSGPAKDLSIKEGRKITVNIGGFGGSSKRREPKQVEAPIADAGFGFLAPPPSVGQSRSRRRQQQQPEQSEESDLASAPAALPSAPAQQPAQVAEQPLLGSTAPAGDDLLGDFSGFRVPTSPTPASPPAPSSPPAPAPGPGQSSPGIADQFDMLSLGGCGGSAPSVAPPAFQPNASTLPPAPGVFGSDPSPVGAPHHMARSGGGYGSPAAAPVPQAPSAMPAPPAVARPGFDALAGVDLLGGPSPMAASPWAIPPFQQPPGQGSDPFDIFK